MPDKEYGDELAISQSSIKHFRNVPPIDWKKVWITKEVEQKSSNAIKRGSLVDDLLFNPTIVENKYRVMEIKKPPASVSFIIDRLALDKNLEDQKANIIKLAKEVPMGKDDAGQEKIGWGQGKGWGDERIFNTVFNDGMDYFLTLQKNIGKCVLPSTEYMESLMMVEKVKQSELCKPYLDPEYNKFQFQIVTDEDFPEKMKGCLDILHINNKTKEIRDVDFKTADSAFYFETNVRKFDYLEQVTFYDKLIEYWVGKNPKYEDYQILPPLNIVIDRTYNIPYIYEYNAMDMAAAWFGYFKYGKWKKGIIDTIKDIQWHVVNDKWDYPIEHYLYDKIKLNLISHNNN